MSLFATLSITNLDETLRSEMDGDTSEWTIWEAEYPDATVSNQGYHIIHNAGAKRGGIVFVGSGSSGVTDWTDAETPEEVLARFLADDMRR